MKGRGIPEGVVLCWVWLYTLGSEAGTRQDRRAEIESDLWEHREYATGEGDRSAAISLSILGRWVAGIPADLSWRASQRPGASGITKESTMTNILGRYWWQALAAFTAVATIYTGFRQFFTDEVSVGVDAGKIIALVLLLVAGFSILLGLAMQRTMARRGSMMVIVGVLPAAMVGLFGIGIIVGLIASFVGGEGWWWVPVGVTSAVATAAGVGAFGAWWHAGPASATTGSRIELLPLGFVLAGLVAAGAGVMTGAFTIPLLIFGAIICLIGIGVWGRRTHTSP